MSNWDRGTDAAWVPRKQLSQSGHASRLPTVAASAICVDLNQETFQHCGNKSFNHAQYTATAP